MPTVEIDRTLSLDLNQTLGIVRRNDVPPAFYCINGLGNGECVGISNQSGRWETYFSERGARTSVVLYDDESAACLAFLKQLELHLGDYGIELDLLGQTDKVLG